MENENVIEEPQVLTPERKAEIEKKINQIKEAKKVKKVYALFVEGDPDAGDEKELFVGYFKQPDFMTFSKYLTISQKQDPSVSMRQLAKDCFLDGDRDLVDDDSLFIFGLMPQLSVLIQTRKGGLVNFSKTGK